MKATVTATNASDQELAAEVERNSAEWMRLRDCLPWVEFHDDGDVYWLFAGDTWPRNTVALARFAPGAARRRVEEILAHHLRHTAACNWILGAATQPPDLGHELKARGFFCRLHCAAMACNLGALPPPPPAPPGVSIQVVEAPPSLKPPTTELRRLRREGRALIAGRSPRRVWCFSATADGAPVGETILFAGGQTAGIYDVEVVESFRRRGIGSALIHQALRQARELGYEVAVLGATGLGSNVYVRQGFRSVGKLSFWKYGRMRQLERD